MATNPTVIDLWWAIDRAWRDENGLITRESAKWSHILRSDGSIASRKVERP